jgi:predicted nucleotide-binding protein
MNKTEVLQKLQDFRDRLQSDVVNAYGQRGSSYGRERFAAWRNQFSKFLDQNLPGASSKLNAKLQRSVFVIGRGESDVSVFLREDGESCFSFIDSLRLDIENDEFDFSPPSPPQEVQSSVTKKPSLKNKRIFIVHGHDDLLKTKTARFVEKLGFEAVILHEQASKGMTIIEKIEANTDVGFAIVLYTGDDRGNTEAAAGKGELNARARQNVVFEHGYLVAKLTRSHVVPLVSGNMELPGDISGMVYVDDANWQIEVAKEMKAAGYAIDFNKIVGG